MWLLEIWKLSEECGNTLSLMPTLVPFLEEGNWEDSGGKVSSV